MTVVNDADIVRRIMSDRPSFHLSGTAHWDALPGTLHGIRSVVHRGDVTLEVGAGVSTVVFAASGARHTSISPDPDEHRLIREYCKSIGVDDSELNFIVGFSDDVLPSHLTRERTLDVALVDGAHSFPIPILDWHYVARALKVGGKLIIDDVPVPAVRPMFEHMNKENFWRLEKLLDSRAAEFTLLSEPSSYDDWRNQRFNSRYPDYSYTGMPKRVLLSAEFRTRPLRASLGRRFPGLRQVYRDKFKSAQG